MTSKAERKRRKKAKPDPFALAAIPRRERNGRVQRDPMDSDPARDQLAVRCKMAGKEPTPANLREMRAPWWGCNAGQTIAALADDEDDRRNLWDAICHMRRAWVAYDRAIGAPGRHAKCLALLVPLSGMEADASTPPKDERSDEDRQRQAVSAMMQIEGWLGWTDKGAAGECKRVVLDDATVTDATGLVLALRCISDGIRGERVAYRGRA